MINAIGAVLLIGGTAAFGISGVFRLRARSRSLAVIIGTLGVMQSEICDRLTPMPELLSQLSEEAAYPASLLFKNAEEKMKSGLGGVSFATIWRQAVSDTPELMLKCEEASVLHELGQSLGKYNAEQQKRALQYAERKMEDFRKKADNERDTNSKLHAFLGVTAGVFAAVILI
ncbi:MAG: stage III sporulation protein AB [Oscillospiraceae bacterium]|nr:stage III sporulation protein AB [Oscillospiraceae bacterium]